MWRNRNPHALLVEMSNGAVAVANSLAVSSKDKCGSTIYDPAIPLLGIYPRELKGIKQILIQQRSSQHYSQKPKVETTQMSLNR